MISKDSNTEGPSVDAEVSVQDSTDVVNADTSEQIEAQVESNGPEQSADRPDDKSPKAVFTTSTISGSVAAVLPFILSYQIIDGDLKLDVVAVIFGLVAMLGGLRALQKANAGQQTPTAQKKTGVGALIAAAGIYHLLTGFGVM